VERQKETIFEEGGGDRRGVDKEKIVNSQN
jgi:hypothetical protein